MGACIACRRRDEINRKNQAEWAFFVHMSGRAPINYCVRFALRAAKEKKRERESEVCQMKSACDVHSVAAAERLGDGLCQTDSLSSQFSITEAAVAACQRSRLHHYPPRTRMPSKKVRKYLFKYSQFALYSAENQLFVYLEEGENWKQTLFSSKVCVFELISAHNNNFYLKC